MPCFDKHKSTTMYLLKLITLIFFLVFIYCAHQVAPTGGPSDELPPKILRTIPESGTLNFPVKKDVILYFSEWVDPRNVKRSITVFPTLPDGFNVTIAGKRVEIKPKTVFAESTTYHIGINAQLTDLHDVSVGTPFNVFFSTGPSIDSGTVHGCVIETEGKNVQPKVALFRCEKDTLPDTAFLNLPSYLIQTDSAGVFCFRHIRKGNYFIIAFVDESNDNRLTPGKEAAYAPLDKKFVLEKEAGPFLLFPVSSDTMASKVSSIKAISATMISGEWEEGTGRKIFNEDYDWTVISLDSNVKAPGIDEYIPVTDSRLFALKLSDSLTTGSYSLIYRINPRILIPLKINDSTVNAEKVGESLFDTLRFNGTLYSDTVRPVFNGAEPSLNAYLDAAITLKWSGPVKPMFHKWFIADTLGDTVFLAVDTSFGEITYMRPARRMLPGSYYFTILPAEYFKDFVGNNPVTKDYLSKKDSSETDSTKVDSIPVIYIKFTTISSRELCHSLAGGASCLEPENRRIWQFLPLNSSSIYSTNENNSQFRFDSIPGAKGIFGYYDDYNSDKEYTAGSLFPWIPPEPRFTFPEDTVEARARWDVEGIEIPACDVCGKEEEKIEAVVDTLERDKEAIDNK